MISRSQSFEIAFALLLVGGCASVPSTKAGAGSRSDDEAAASRLAVRFDELRRDQRIPGLAVVILRDTKGQRDAGSVVYCGVTCR
jgi:uncharacterized protein YceK